MSHRIIDDRREIVEMEAAVEMAKPRRRARHGDERNGERAQDDIRRFLLRFWCNTMIINVISERVRLSLVSVNDPARS